MPCYRPRQGWYHADGGRPVISPRSPALGSADWVGGLIDCRQCFGCQEKAAREWGLRCYHESKMHQRNCFLTLTYDDRHLPRRGQLCKPDLRQFFLDLRNELRGTGIEFKVYACGEYGGLTRRPHYHACLFGLDFDDKVFTRTSHTGYKVYESKELTRIWGKGIATIGDLTIETANYCARYCVKKRNLGTAVEDWRFRHASDSAWHIDPDTGRRFRFEPEFSIKSKGLGFSFLAKYHRDVFHLDGDFCMLPGGIKVRTPDAYLRELRKWCEQDYFDLKARRRVEADLQLADALPSRLSVREEVARARVSHLKREAV